LPCAAEHVFIIIKYNNSRSTSNMPIASGAWSCVPFSEALADCAPYSHPKHWEKSPVKGQWQADAIKSSAKSCLFWFSDTKQG